MENEYVILIGSIIVQIIGVIMSRNLLTYRLEQLEKKVDKHNNIVERTYKLEGKVESIEGDIDEIKGTVR